MAIIHVDGGREVNQGKNHITLDGGEFNALNDIKHIRDIGYLGTFNFLWP